MPLNPRSIHGADHPQRAADAPRDGFRDWSRHAGGPATAPARARAPEPEPLGLDLSHPLLRLAAVAFAGYTLGRLVHRDSTAAVPAAAPPPRPAPAVRLRPPEREPRSSIRFR